MRECGASCQRDVIRHRVRSKLLRHDGQFRMQNFPESPSALQSIPSNQPPTASQQGATFQLAIVLHGLRRLDADPILQSGDWLGKLRRRIWDLGRRSVHRHRRVTTTLPHTRRVCLQSTPAAAATDQPHHPDPSRLVRRSDSSLVRAGSPPGRQYHGNGDTRVQVRTVVPEMRPNKLFCRGYKLFPFTWTGVQMRWKRRRSWMASIFCWPRVNWLTLRGTARPERTFLPILEVLTYSRGSSSRHSSSGERSSARRSLPARLQGDQTTRACARVLWSGMRSPHSVPCSRLSQGTHFVHVLVLIRGPDVMEKEEKLDSRRIVSLGHILRCYG